MARKKISEVFTPRRSDINEKMYVGRPSLEKSLLRAIEGSQHVLLCGESGNGKTWLYRKVLHGKYYYIAANCANASHCSSITKEIEQISFNDGDSKKLSYVESKGAGLKAIVADANVSHTGSYELRQQDPLLEALKNISKRSPTESTIIVLENLESIFSSPDLMDELARIILLLDDPRYAATKVKFLIVGTPTGVIEYFSKTKNLDSVSNRISELPKVGGLSDKEVKQLVTKGFVHELSINISENEIVFLADHIFNVTMGVAQRVHEYCEQLAFQIEDNDWNYDKDLIKNADWAWLTGGLRQSYAVLEGKLNSRDTSVARRNQAIFSIGKIKVDQFDTAIIEAHIRREFPETVKGKNLGISTILTELTAEPDPLLIRNQKTGQYRVKDPRYVMCIRTALFKDVHSGKVRKRNFIAG